MNKNEIEKVKRQHVESLKPKAKREIDPHDFLSTGSTLLNLACTGRPWHGIGKGQYFFIVGDSSSGKTFLALTMLAEACRSKRFAEHRIIFDNAENGALMNIERFFGKALYERMEPPAINKASGEAANSVFLRDFYGSLYQANQQERPFIYLIDSMDALQDYADEEKFEAEQNGKKVGGSYGMGKAKTNSERMRRVVDDLEKSGSILIVLSQTRENVDPFSMETKARAGGKALRFYAHIEIWMSTVEKLKRTVNGKQRTIGIRSKVQIKKNRVVGHEVAIEFPIYRSVGIDDMGSCVDYLVSEGHWTKNKSGMIGAAEFSDAPLRLDDVVKIVEEENREKEMRSLVADVWHDIEEKCKVPRKPRY